MARTIGLVLAGALVLGLVPGTLATSPSAVDPSTLTPPPNPNFVWNCTSNGQRIDCIGVESSSAIDENPDPAFSCSGVPILVTFTQTLTAHRTHDAEGRVLRNHTIGTFDETWRLAGMSGPVLTSRGRWSLVVTYAEPGVVESRTIAYSGAQLTLSAPGEGVIFQNTGHIVTNWDESEVLAVHGPFIDFDAGIAAACDAFGA
ncbi:MAG: hypothetical protein H0V73_02955 [Chloroflexi bacterium]|nr:hypothetical protein [Chloroflexota bacterium]